MVNFYKKNEIILKNIRRIILNNLADKRLKIINELSDF